MVFCLSTLPLGKSTSSATNFFDEAGFDYFEEHGLWKLEGQLLCRVLISA